MNRNFYKTNKSGKAFSLAEVIVSLTIGSMVLVVTLMIYNRIEKAAGAIERKLDSTQMPAEVLQRIAEDLDRIVSNSKGVKITIKNKLSELYTSAQLTISKTINDKNNKKQAIEDVIWQTSYDYESDAEGLILYRSHSGIATEDKLLDESRKDWEEDYTFVPICSGVTFFQIQIASNEFKRNVSEDEDQMLELELPEEEILLTEWDKESLPNGIVVTISFAESFKDVDGTFNVIEKEKISRTIAIDRTRNIKLILPKKTEKDEEYGKDEEVEPERVADSNQIPGP